MALTTEVFAECANGLKNPEEVEFVLTVLERLAKALRQKERGCGVLKC